MRSATRGYLQSFRCDAPSGALWDALVRPEGLARWYAQRAEIEARPGGRYFVSTRLLGDREAHIDVFEPTRRLRLIYDPHPDWPPAGDHVIVEDFLIDENPRGDEGATVIRLLGSGVPDSQVWDLTFKRLRSAWAVSFSYLEKFLEEQGHRTLLARHA